MHRFEQEIWCFEKTGIRAEMLHLANSAAIFNGWARGDDQLRSLARNYQIGVRPGLMLYGLSPFEDGRGAADLKPILQWDANIVGRKKIPAGEKIGYGCTFATVMETEIAIVRIGYGDGFSRALSNVGALIVAGEKCPVLGRVSMDLITIDVTEVVKKQGAGACGLNARATIIGVNGEAHIRAEELAKQSKTISWEILTCISDRVERVYPP